eukprot:s447_g17.t1
MFGQSTAQSSACGHIVNHYTVGLDTYYLEWDKEKKAALAILNEFSGNMDDPGPESFGDRADLPRILDVKPKAAIAFHKANQDMALRAAVLHRARVEEDELMVGDYVFYWKPQTHKLDPFRWRGPCMVIAVEAAMDRNTTVYWIVHGSSLVRATRQQLRHETIPERYERQADLVLKMIFSDPWLNGCYMLSVLFVGPSVV